MCVTYKFVDLSVEWGEQKSVACNHRSEPAHLTPCVCVVSVFTISKSKACPLGNRYSGLYENCKMNCVHFSSAAHGWNSERKTKIANRTKTTSGTLRSTGFGSCSHRNEYARRAVLPLLATRFLCTQSAYHPNSMLGVNQLAQLIFFFHLIKTPIHKRDGESQWYTHLNEFSTE